MNQLQVAPLPVVLLGNHLSSSISTDYNNLRNAGMGVFRSSVFAAADTLGSFLGADNLLNFKEGKNRAGQELSTFWRYANLGLGVGQAAASAVALLPVVRAGGAAFSSLTARLSGSVAADLAAEEAAVNASSSIGATRRIGEEALRTLGGESEVFFRTSRGGRFVDQLVNGIAHESKVGYQTLTKRLQAQIAKDIELMESGAVDAVKWHFFQSPLTGRIGGSKPLLDALQEAGIEALFGLP